MMPMNSHLGGIFVLSDVIDISASFYGTYMPHPPILEHFVVSYVFIPSPMPCVGESYYPNCIHKKRGLWSHRKGVADGGLEAGFPGLAAILGSAFLANLA